MTKDVNQMTKGELTELQKAIATEARQHRTEQTLSPIGIFILGVIVASALGDAR